MCAQCVPGASGQCFDAVRALKADESVCTPGSVPAPGYPSAGDGHPSRPCVAAGLERSTQLCFSEENRAGSPQTQSV